MEDGIKTIGLGGTSAALGRAVGTGLGSGIEALAKMKLQSMQKEKSAQALSHFVGGNINAARRMMDLTEKERFAVLQNLSGQGGQDGLSALSGQGVNFFAKQPNVQLAETLRHNQTKELSEQRKELRDIEEIAEKKKIYADKVSEQQKNKSDAFYKENIQPDFDKTESLKDTNEKLESVIKSSKGVTSLDRIAELFKDSKNPFVSGFATFLQSTSSASAIKSTAQFLQQYSKTVGGGKSTQFLVEAYMKQYPDALLQDVPTVGKLAEEIIRFNNFFIERTYLKHAIFDENPNIDQKGLNSELIRYSKELSEKKNEELMTDQNEDQPQPQPQPQPQELIPRPIDQIQPTQNFTQTQVPIKEKLTPEEVVALDWEKGEKVEGKPLIDFSTVTKNIPGVSKALQIIVPNISRLGDDVKDLSKHLPEGDNNFIEGVRKNFAPTREEAEKTLLKLGVTQEEIDNPSLFVKHMRDYAPPVAALLGAGAISGPIGVVVALGAMASAKLTSKVAESIGETYGGEAGKDYGRIIGKYLGAGAGAKLSKKAYQEAEIAIKTYKSKKDFIAKGTAKAEDVEEKGQARVDKINIARRRETFESDTTAAQDKQRKIVGMMVGDANAKLPKTPISEDQQSFLNESLKKSKIENPVIVDPNKANINDINNLRDKLITSKPSDILDSRGRKSFTVPVKSDLSLKTISEVKKDLSDKLFDNISTTERTYIKETIDILNDVLKNGGGDAYNKDIIPANKAFSKLVKYHEAKLERIESDKISAEETQNEFDLSGKNTASSLRAIGSDKEVGKALKEAGFYGSIAHFFNVTTAAVAKGVKSVWDYNKNSKARINLLAKENPEEHKILLNLFNDFRLNPSKSRLTPLNIAFISYLSKGIKEKENKEQEEYISPKPREVDLEIVKKSKKTK